MAPEACHLGMAGCANSLFLLDKAQDDWYLSRYREISTCLQMDGGRAGFDEFIERQVSWRGVEVIVSSFGTNGTKHETLTKHFCYFSRQASVICGAVLFAKKSRV